MVFRSFLFIIKTEYQYIGTYVTKEDPEYWLTYLNCPKCTGFFFYILKNKDLFQILGLTGSCIGLAKLANFSITSGL